MRFLAALKQTPRLLLLAAGGLWLLAQAPFWPLQTSIKVFVNPSGTKDYSVKQSLLSRFYEEWLLRATLQSDSATRNEITESLRRLRSGHMLSVENLGGGLWQVSWTHSDPQVLELLGETSATFLRAYVPARKASPVAGDQEMVSYERKLARNMLLDGAGIPPAERDYVDPSDYARSVRARRAELWKHSQLALQNDLAVPVVRVLERERVPQRLSLGSYTLLCLLWCAGLAQTLRSRRP